MSEQTDHLPECWDHPDLTDKTGHPCICERLRACEKRVLLSKPNIELSALYGYELGHAEALDAARDAVEALRGDNGWTGNPTAAIDALRGESNE